MTDLIERLKTAEAGSPQANCEVARTFGYYVPDEPWAGWKDPDGKHVGLAPPTTTSLNAVVAMAERFFPGWHWRIDLQPGEATVQGAADYWSEGLVASDRGGVYVTARTAALAFSAAIVLAKDLRP